MRLGLTLACVFVLCALGIVTSLDGPLSRAAWLPEADVLLIGLLIFFSCLTGMFAARISERSLQAERLATGLARANMALETQVWERTNALRVKMNELEEARVDAVAANQAKSRFLASMSHELRTPLNAILGFSELIEREIYGAVGDRRYTEYARLIHLSGSHLLSLIRDVLDLSKIEAGKMELHPEALNVAGIVGEAQDLVGAKSKLANRIELEVDADLPLLLADRRAVVQMTVNLLSNAIKFTPPPGVIVLAATANEDGGLSIEVRDSGVGIAKTDIPRALSAFGQIDSELARKHEGTGLGLPIVASLMEMHGGRLELESEPGKGTIARLIFPAERSLRGVGESAAA